VGAESPTWIEALFRPRAVALIGASSDPAKIGARPLRYLRKHGFTGPIYPINRNREEVLGEPAYPNLEALPGPVDHAYVLVNTGAVEAAVRACVAAGVPVATIIAGGFGEAGERGAASQARLLDIAASGGMRLLGPNSLGVVNPVEGLALTANAAFEAESLLPGRLTVLSQSGSIIGTLFSRGFARGIGFAKLVSVGNEADLGVGEIGGTLVDDPDSDAFLLFLETLRRADDIARFADRAHAAGKPVIAYKLGRSQAGREAALAHTGALAGPDAAADAFLADHGILRVDTFEALLEMAPLVMGRRPPLKRDGAAAVVTTTGGGGAMLVDRLGALGIEVRGATPASGERLAAAGVNVQPGRLIDVTLAGARAEVMETVLDQVLEDEDVDVVVSAIGSSAQFHPDLAVRPLIDRADTEKPLAAFLVPQADESLKLLAEAGVPAFRTPESCADAVRAYLTWRSPRRSSDQSADAGPAEALLAQARGQILHESHALELFSALGIPCVPSLVVAPGELPPALPFAFPVAAKVLSPDITHKTDIGGVRLDIPDSLGLAAAVRALVDEVKQHQPRAHLDGVLVQRMEHGLAEALIGYRQDAEVGPIVTLGAGGTLAEIYRDVAVRLAPLDRASAREMIEEVRGLATVRGYRGLPEGDLDALADALARLSHLADLQGRRVREAEINPIVIRPDGEGVVAVDGFVAIE
jgi:acyl-CoA synthetase (NDP forming)